MSNRAVPFYCPYCGDEEIARVAHSYGWHREAATVHTNPLSKVYICQTIGSAFHHAN